MKYKILSRKDKGKIPFREALLGLLKAKGDTLILGYGYLDPKFFKSDDEVRQALKVGFSGIINPKVIILGKHKEIDLKSKKVNTVDNYIEVGESINNLLQGINKNTTVKVLISQEENYHKKLAFKLNKQEHIISILGSSNLTEKTFEIKSKSFNQEVDVLFWNTFKLSNSYINDFESSHDDFNEIGELEIEYGISLGAQFDIEDILREISEAKGFFEAYPKINNEFFNSLVSRYMYYKKNIKEEVNKKYFDQQYEEFKKFIKDKSKYEIYKKWCKTKFSNTFCYNILKTTNIKVKEDFLNLLSEKNILNLK